jgi:hypothetical protein
MKDEKITRFGWGLWRMHYVRPYSDNVNKIQKYDINRAGICMDGIIPVLSTELGGFMAIDNTVFQQFTYIIFFSFIYGY